MKSVAHGAANSAAKVSGSLSYGISKATVYDKYNEKRDAFTLRHDTKTFLKIFQRKVYYRLTYWILYFTFSITEIVNSLTFILHISRKGKVPIKRLMNKL